MILHSTGTFSGAKATLLDRMAKQNAVVVTTYAALRIYKDLLLRCRWDYVVLDEGHKIRNPNAEITLVCKQVCSCHCVVSLIWNDPCPGLVFILIIALSLRPWIFSLHEFMTFHD